MSMESALRVGRMVGISGKRGGGDAEALFSRPARAGVAGGRGWVAADGGGPALWDRPLDGISLASAGARGGPSLCQTAWRWSRAGDRPGGRDDPAGAGGRAQRPHARRIRRAFSGTHRAAAGQPADPVPGPAAARAMAQKRRCAPASAIAPTSKRSGRSSANGCGNSTPRTWSSSTRAASPRR